MSGTSESQMAPSEVNYKIPEEMISKLDEVLDFVRLAKARIEKNTDRYMKPKEAAAYLKVSVNCLMRNLKHQITHSKEGRSIHFDVLDLDEYRKARKVRGALHRGSGDPKDLDEFKWKHGNKNRKRSQGMATSRAGGESPALK